MGAINVKLDQREGEHYNLQKEYFQSDLQITQSKDPQFVRQTIYEVKLMWNEPAENVYVQCDAYNNWQEVQMKRNEKGEFQLRVDLIPGIYHYQFIVDGTTRIDPLNNTIICKQNNQMVNIFVLNDLISDSQQGVGSFSNQVTGSQNSIFFDQNERSIQSYYSLLSSNSQLKEMYNTLQSKKLQNPFGATQSNQQMSSNGSINSVGSNFLYNPQQQFQQNQNYYENQQTMSGEDKESEIRRQLRIEEQKQQCNQQNIKAIQEQNFDDEAPPLPLHMKKAFLRKQQNKIKSYLNQVKKLKNQQDEYIEAMKETNEEIYLEILENQKENPTFYQKLQYQEHQSLFVESVINDREIETAKHSVLNHLKIKENQNKNLNQFNFSDHLQQFSITSKISPQSDKQVTFTYFTKKNIQYQLNNQPNQAISTQ